MALTRRKLLAGGAAAAGAAVAPGCGGGRSAATTTATAPRAARAAEDLSTWAGVRAELPLDPKLRHFAAFLLAPHPRPGTAPGDGDTVQLRRALARGRRHAAVGPQPEASA